MKRYSTLVCSIVAFVLFSLSFGQDDMVKLLRSENYACNGYNTGWGYFKEVQIQVKNVAYEKHVYVHHSKSDGSWVDVPAHYVRPGNSTYEIWCADSTGFGDTSDYGNQFVLKYEVLGQTFWDNNNGSNYTLINSSNGPGPMLGNNINVLLKQANIGSDGKLFASIDVRNIAYAKNVKLTYTTNNWATSSTVNASYSSCSQTGWSSFIYWPNAYNIERWYANSPTPITGTIQFYISYTMDDQTYYDNNYWSNYILSN